MIHSLYIPKHFRDNISYIERMADANGRSVNAQIIFMLSEYITEHRRYQDSKITDYETKEISEMFKESPDIVCPECRATKRDVDEAGFTIHDFGCSNNKRGPIWNE